MITKLLEIALAEEGYLEKKSNADLDDKTKNAGNKNYTKYWRDIYPYFQAQPWCDCFVKWCFVKAFGKEKAKELLCTNNFSYACKISANYFVKKGQFDKTPKVGSQIFFWNNDKTLYGHTGIVYKVDKKYVYTVEGNTSSGSGVIANGGAVACKKYALTNSRIAGYGHPKYDISVVDTAPKPTEETAVYYVVKKGDTLSKIAKLYSTTAAKIKALNPNKIKDINKIVVGWKIRVK